MSNKKGKKSKGVTMSMSEFVAKVEETTGAPSAGLGQNVVYSEKKKQMPMMSSWADEVDEDAGFFEKERIILPSAPRAARGPAYDDSEIPREPPFTAHLGNIPYNTDEEEISKFFRELEIVSFDLPRDQQTDRLRGFGRVEFATRADLIEALTRNEQMIMGRPLRVGLGNGQHDRRGGNDMDRGMRGDGERRRGRPPAEDDDVTDWRSMCKGPDAGGEPEFRRGPPSGDYNSMPRGGFREGGGGGFRDRGYDGGRGPRGPPQDEDMDFSRSSMMQGPPPPAPSNYNTYGGRSNRGGYGGGRDREFGGYDGGRGGGYNRGGDRDRDYQGRGGYQQQYPRDHSRHHSESSDHDGPSREDTWRRGPAPREHTTSISSQSSAHNTQGGYRDDDGPRRDRTLSPSERSRHEYEDDIPAAGPPQSQAPKERKRLVLQPRTVDKPVGETEVGASSIFGGAKPVDTQRREREIEEKLQQLHVEDSPKEAGADGSKDEESQEKGERTGGSPRDRDERRDRPPTDGPRGGDRERPKQFSDDRGGPGSYRGRGGQGPRRDDRREGGGRDMDRRGGDMDRRGGDMDRRGGDMDRRGGDMDRRGGDMDRRGGDMDRRGDYDRSGGRGGEFRRGPPRDNDGPRAGRGGYDRDQGAPRGGRGGGGYRDYERSDRDDFRRPEPIHRSNNNQTSSIGSQSEERDRDSHSEPEDDRDMMRGGDREQQPRRTGGEFSDEDSEFTRVERRGRKNYNSRLNQSNNNQTAAAGNAGGGGRAPPRNNDRW